MGFESSARAEEEKRKKELSEKQKKEEREKVLEQEKHKKEAREQKENHTEILDKLEQMLENDSIDLSSDDEKLLQKIIESGDITTEEIEEILSKIEEIENTQDVDSYLPKDFRITSEEYKTSLTNDVVRLKTITKLNTGLTILSQNITDQGGNGLNLFSGYMAILDKKLIKIQENTIDVKDCLKKIDKKKNPGQNKSLWQKIIDFLKEVFNG